MANFATIRIKTTVQAQGRAVISRPHRTAFQRHLEILLDHDGGRKRPKPTLPKLSFLPPAADTTTQKYPTAGDLHRATLPMGHARPNENRDRHYSPYNQKQQTANNKQLTAAIIAFFESRRWPDPVRVTSVCNALPKSILQHRNSPRDFCALVGRALATLGYRKITTGRTRRPPGPRGAKKKSSVTNHVALNKQKNREHPVARKQKKGV